MRLDAGSTGVWASIILALLIVGLAARFYTVAAFFVRLLSGRFTFKWFRDRYKS
jgi:hypothetical protein